MKELSLRIVTPKGELVSLRCDSVRLTVSDDGEGKGGGSLGIRPGHVRAVLSLQPGPLLADLSGTRVLSARCGGGFATVNADCVTVVAEECEID